MVQTRRQIFGVSLGSSQIDNFKFLHTTTLVLVGAAFRAHSLAGTSVSAPVITKVCGGYQTAVESTL